MGGKTSTTTQQVQIPKEVMDRYNAVNAQAQQVASNPFQVYSTDPAKFVAQINQQQQAGIDQINQASNSYQPFFQGAASAVTAGMGSADPRALNTSQFMNPYQQSVIDATMRQMGQANEQAQSGALGTAISSGAFGGDRAGIAAANLANQQGMAMGSTLAGLNAQNYNQALAAAQQQQGVYLGADQANLARLLQGGQTLAGLGSAYQQAGLQGAEAMLNAGTLQQQTDQAGLSALYNQFQQQQAYPFQVAQFLANIAMGTGALSGSTTTTTQPGSFWSDRRLKHDIKRIGTADNGLPVYTFKYKGDDTEQTHVGYMADEVEKKHPDAVGVAPNGYKYVDYDRASRAQGGGVAGPYGMQVGSQNPGVTGYVPEAYLPVGDLMIADGSLLDNARQGMAAELEAVAGLGKNLQSLDSTWDFVKDKWGSEPRAETVRGAERFKDRFNRGGVAGYATGGTPEYLKGVAGGAENPVAQSTYLSSTLSDQDKQKHDMAMAQPGSAPGQPESTMSKIGNVASTALAVAQLLPMLSDRRAKHDIRRIGRTDHGLPIYSFKYNGDDREQTHVGFMADEVEQHHPDAVHTGLDGLKRVDYAQAHKFYRGGIVGRHGYATDGAVETEEERLRRLRALEPGAATNMLPSGVAPQPDRISAPVSYNLPENRPDVAFQTPLGTKGYYDPDTGMMRDAAGNAVTGVAGDTFRNIATAGQEAERAGLATGLSNAMLMQQQSPTAERTQAMMRAQKAYDLSTALPTANEARASYVPPSELAMRNQLSGLIPAAGTPFSNAYSAHPAGLALAAGTPFTQPRPAARPEGLAGAMTPTVSAISSGVNGAASAPAPTGGMISGVAGAGAGYTDVILPDGRVERREGARNWRNNNPGNIEYGDFAKAHGAVGSDGRFAVFPSYEAGRSAKEALLFSSEGYADKTIAQAISRYAPASDGNDTAQYIATVAQSVGVDPDTPLSALDPQQRQAMLTAMERVEGGGAGNERSFASYRTYPQPSGGVAGSVPGASSYDAAGLKPYGDRNLIGKMFHNEDGTMNRDALLSLASGVGAMLSSPSQYFLPSVGLGLQGFAGTYAGLQKQASDIGLQNAQARREGINAVRDRFFTESGVPMVTVDPNAPPVTLDQFLANPDAYSTGNPAMDAQMRLEAANRKAYPGTQTPAAGNDGTIFSVPMVQDYVQNETKSAIMNLDAAKEESLDIEKRVEAAAEAARASRASLLLQTDAVSNLVSPDKAVRSGALGQLKMQAIRYANELLTLGGQPPISGPDDAQIAEKAAIAASLDRAAGGGQQSFEALNALLATSPNVQNEPEANAKLMATLMLAQQRSNDLAEFTRGYKLADGNRFNLVRDAGKAFDRAYGRRYLAEEGALKTLILHGSEIPPSWAAAGITKTPMDYMMDQSLSPQERNEVARKVLTIYGYPEAQIAALADANGNIDLSRYFGG